ncbi:hypothetical protein D3C86_1052480 [compost metagenome]
MHEVSRTQNGCGDVEAFDHAFNRMFAGEVRNIGELVGVNHRQVNDTLDASLLSEVQRDEGLRHLIGRNGVEQEQRPHRRQRDAHRRYIGEVCNNFSDAGREIALSRLAY